MSVLDRLRPRPKTWTDAERAALVDELLAERFTPPPVPVSELHLQFGAAVRERDRLQHLGRAAAEEVGRLAASEAQRRAARPKSARQIEADYQRLRAPHEAQQRDLAAALADLNAVADWEALEDGERRFRQAVEEAMPAHDEVRRSVVAEALDRAQLAYDTARQTVDYDAPRGPLGEALRAVADAEAELVMVRRWHGTVPETPGRKGRR